MKKLTFLSFIFFIPIFKKKNFFLLLIGLINTIPSHAQSVFVTPNNIRLGQSTYAYWDGFPGNINLELWKGSSKIADVWANAPGSCTGGCNVELNTANSSIWIISSNYRIKAVLRSNTDIYNFSNYFAVASPTPPPTIPVLSNPNDGATLNDNTPDLAWTADNASYFHVQVSMNSSFTNIVRENTNCYNLNWTPSTMSDGTYYWRVRTYGVDGSWSSWSGYRYFTIETVQPPSVPTLTYPPNRATLNDNTPDLAWTADNASYFHVQISTNSSFTNIVRENINCNNLNWTPSTMSDGTYYWRVRTYGVDGSWSSWSGYRYFTIETVQPPSVPILTYPPNGAALNDNTPDLAWTADNASYFHIQISTNSSFTNIVRENTNCNGFNWTPSTMSDGTYYWRVRAYGVNGSWSNWSVVRFFNIQTNPPPPSLIAPSGEIPNVSNIEFQWNSVSGADRYRVKICTDQNMTSQISGSPFEADVGETEISIPVTYFTSGQTYYWQAASIYPDDAGGWGEYGPSSAWSFIITEEQAIELISPSSNQQITSKEVTFSWSSISGAVQYELYVDNNSGLGSPEISPQHIDSITSTSFTISGNWLTPGLGYYWKVIAKDADGNILAESTTGTFSYAPEPDASPQWVPLYRAFHPDVVDHFYCSSETHLQTAMDNNYQFEGTEGYIALYPFEVGTSNELAPVYRFYQDSDTLKKRCHYYTSSSEDRDNRIIQGWIYEGIIGYGFENSATGLTPLHHTYLDVPDNRRDNFYTISEIEKSNSILSLGYQDIGQVCYLSATGENSTVTWESGSIAAGAGINPFNGNFGNGNQNIFSLPEGKISLDYSHSYNSSAVRLYQSSEPLGVGRTHNYNISLHKTDSTFFIQWGDEVHLYNASDLSCLTPGVYDVLSAINSTTYQICKKDQTKYTFEKLNVNNTGNTYWLKEISDKHGNSLTLEYNANGWLKHVKSPAGRYISFTYYPSSDTNRYGLLRYVKDSLALNRQVEYIYDNQRNLTEFIDVAGNSTQYIYDSEHPFDHFLEEIIYPDGTKITNTYNVESKRLISQQFVSGDENKLTTVSLPTAGQVDVKDEMDVLTTIKYDNIGNVSELLTASGDAIYEYSDDNNPTKPTKITDGMGYITTVEYDDMGNPEVISKPLDVTHQYAWNSQNDITSYVNPLGKTTTFTYTDGKLTAVESPFGESSSVTTNISYFSNGNIQTVTNPLDQTTTYTYDIYNNVKTIADNIGNTTTYTYDAASRIKSSKDANNNEISYEYYSDDLLKSLTNPMNHITSYYYDAFGRLTKVEDAKNNTTEMVYQPQTGLLESVSDQMANNTTLTYLDNGLLQTKTNRNNQTFTYGYDAVNRLETLSGPSINRTFNYNKNDLLTQLSDNNGNLSFDYDALNRLISHTHDNEYANTVLYGYDKTGNIDSMVYPGNKIVSYTYYDDGSLKTVEDWLGNNTQYIYNSDGSISQINNPNGTYSEYIYDDAGRLTGMANKKSDDSVINSYSFVLDGVGNHTEVTSTEPLDSPIPEAADITYSYNQANRIESAGEITFTHDQNGNMLSQNDNGDVTDFTFSAEDKLIKVSGSFDANYQYDGLGFRRQASRDGAITRYVLDINGEMENILMETDNSNSPKYYYIHGNGLLYRIKVSDNSVQYYHYDVRGSTIAITDQDENLTHKYAYDVFGAVTNWEEPEDDFNPFRYVGKYGVMYESDGLYFMRARYYKPSVGRFLSEDPVWFPNLYIYGNNNPIINIDPDGNFVFTASAIIYVSYKVYKFSRKAIDLYSYLDRVGIILDEIKSYEEQQERYKDGKDPNNPNASHYYDLESAKQDAIARYNKMRLNELKDLSLSAIPIYGDIRSAVKDVRMVINAIR